MKFHLARLALALVLSPTLLHAQSPLFSVDLGGFGGDQDSSAVSKADSFVFEPTVNKQTQIGFVSAAPGRLRADVTHFQVAGISGTPNSFTGLADSQYYDVVFSSSDGQPVSGTLRLTLDGTQGPIWRGVVSVSVGFLGFHTGEYTYLAPDFIVTSGLLSGYGGEGAKVLSIPFSNAPVGTEIALSVRLFVDAQSYGGGTSTSLDYVVSFGAPGGDAPLFDLPPGASVDIASANVQNNVWTPSEDLQLAASPNGPLVTGTDALALTTWNGQPGAPVALFFTEVNGTPILENTFLFNLLDADGNWSLAPIPTSPSLAGLSFGLTAYSLYAGPPAPTLANSPQVVVSFQ